MYRKIGITALAVVAIAFLAGYTRLGGYVWHKVRAGTDVQMPVEVKLDYLKHQVAQLVPDMKKNLSVIAEEMVAIENLKGEVTTVHANLEQQKQTILTMTEDLERTSADRIAYNGKEYKRERISDKLTRDLASYKRCQTELRSKEQLLEAKERSLEVAREQLATMKEQKRELEVQVAELETELKTVRLAQTKSKFQLDDGRLAEIKASLADIRNRLKIEKTEAELQGEFANDFVPVEKKTKPATDITKEVREYFGDGASTDSKVAVQKQ